MSRYEKLHDAIRDNIASEHHSYAEASATWDALHRVVGDLVKEGLGDSYSYARWSRGYERALDLIVDEAVARIKRMGTGPVGIKEEGR